MIFPERSNWQRDLLIVMGMTACLQGLLYWQAFTGKAVLLPVGILRIPGIATVEQDSSGEPVANYARADLIQVSEPNRWFMANEYRSGRIPLWTPYRFAGTSVARSPVFCPYELLYALWPTPRILPWIQLTTAIVSATGAWFFAFRILKLGSLPAITAGVVYPMTGFLVIWQGFDLSYPVTFLPWTASATVSMTRHPHGLKICILAIFTCLTVISGPADMAAMVLMVCGFCWLWIVIWDAIATHWTSAVTRTILASCCGWLLGLALAAPVLLPAFDYIQTGSRVATRLEGFEARPPVGWRALPLIVFPEAYGSEADNSAFVHPSGNRLESSAGAYAGCLSLFFVAPWAWMDRSRRQFVIGMIVLSLLCLGWQLNVPGLTAVLRLPGFQAFSANRMVFASAWCHLMLAAIGLEQLVHSGAIQKFWLRHPAVILTLSTVLFSIIGLITWPDQLQEMLPNGNRGLPLASIQSSFVSAYYFQIVCLALTMLLWLLVISGKFNGSCVRLTGALMIAEPFLRFWGLHSQPPVSHYYPPIPALEFIQKSPEGRTIAIGCLPPNLLESHKLKDIRGYDGVDPLRFIEALSLTDEAGVPDGLEYARTMWFVPEIRLEQSAKQSFRIHPALDMLNLRYLILADGTAEASPDFAANGLAVFENHFAMPRVWVPERVRKLDSSRAVLKAMTPWDFDPAGESMVTDAIPESLPEMCSGKATLTEENPQLLKIQVAMDTTGLVVVSDRFAEGWRATVDGQDAPMVCVNHVLRGVFVTPGHHTIEMRYLPTQFAVGVRVLCISAAVLVLMTCWSLWRRTWVAPEAGTSLPASPFPT